MISGVFSCFSTLTPHLGILALPQSAFLEFIVEIAQNLSDILSFRFLKPYLS